jgi:hypothetical protein
LLRQTSTPEAAVVDAAAAPGYQNLAIKHPAFLYVVLQTLAAVLFVGSTGRQPPASCGRSMPWMLTWQMPGDSL